MNRSVGVLGMTLCACIMLTGCWDVKTISDYNFVTALGIDYSEGKYKIYTELMDFGSISNQDEGGDGGGERATVWVGKSEGETLFAAINELYKTGQQSLYWDHLMAIVLSERVLQKDINRFIDSIPRFPQIRYNSWIFGTHESIDELFKHSTFFNFSPISNLLHNPVVLHKQLSVIAPIRLNKVLANEGEPGETDLIPTLSIDKKDWEDNDKPQPVLFMNGAFALNNGKAQHSFTEKQLNGVKWIQPQMKRAVIPVVRNHKTIGMVTLFNPKKKIHIAVEGGKPVFTMDLKFTGIIEEMLDDSPVDIIREKAEMGIRNEVLNTFKSGIAKHVDLFGLEQTLYRNKNKEWKKLSASGIGGERMLTEDSLKKVNVQVNILHSGMNDMAPH
ncbi:Ger(x)C family spore germination protein [Paenibacillus sp. BC26]|uniref:Ger(x)C family spore germination protein n=1 Tax=Paenibacillus sp. BC26 TaxID=1881032 RepID=UPI0008DFDFC0|nr:Ger(x)C family spore germination protein [Paenibacillus sp. BC26]SFS58086.1 germination protein, Ger(x)C family [Paenibacillus sp. BC26]